YLREDLSVRPRLVEVVRPGAAVGDDAGHATDHRGAGLALGIILPGAVDADAEEGVDTTWEHQPVTRIDHLLGVGWADRIGDLDDLAVPDPQVAAKCADKWNNECAVDDRQVESRHMRSLSVPRLDCSPELSPTMDRAGPRNATCRGRSALR